MGSSISALSKDIFIWIWKLTHLSNHAVPRAIDLLAVFAVGHQVKVVGELDSLGDLFEDVYAEALATALDVDPWISCLVSGRGQNDVVR